MNKFQVTPELIGKYINQSMYTDVNPIGKVIGIKGKTGVIIQPVEASENKTKMKWASGGFAGNCYNQDEQEYDFYEVREPFEMKLSNTKLKSLRWGFADRPIKYYDFNF